MFFYIDPEFETDPKMNGINNIILSYTFFKVSQEWVWSFCRHLRNLFRDYQRKARKDIIVRTTFLLGRLIKYLIFRIVQRNIDRAFCCRRFSIIAQIHSETTPLWVSCACTNQSLLFKFIWNYLWVYIHANVVHIHMHISLGLAEGNIHMYTCMYIYWSQ